MHVTITATCYLQLTPSLSLHKFVMEIATIVESKFVERNFTRSEI